LKFTLTFDGQLRSNGTPTEKWAIRQQLHPQLQELWSIHPLLKSLKRDPYLPKEGRFFHTEQHHSVEPTLRDAAPQPEDPTKMINLCAEIERAGRRFLPLVRETLALKCSLKIQFLRKEDAGHIVYQGGDLDNRIKTLFDGLSVPNKDQVIQDPTIDDPIYCLVEDDALITGLEISTHRLLSRPNASKHDVRLIIGVEVSVSQSRLYNGGFLGD
jgi:hypothetical protein